ncbi:MAG: aspartate aminotransferase family protein [Lachnospiraceae bacterium]|nr:aspartate aminotransferase family protein [Lachnospiraceae bacterium]
MSLQTLYEKEIERYEERTPESAAMYKEASKYLAGGETRSVSYYKPYPLTIRKGEGCQITDVDGHSYYDFINNYTSLIHGHANPLIAKAIAEAAENGTAVPAGMSDQVELARMIVTRTPGVEKVRFCNSGTEATLFAVRAAKAFTGKPGMIKALGGYHGTTDCMEYNVSVEADFEHPEKMLIPRPDIAGVSGEIAKEMYIVPYNDLNAVEDVLKKSADKIAAMIIEPFLGAGGLIPAADGYLKGLRELTSKYNVLLIFDEVQAYRLSEGGAQKRFNVPPDLSAFGKIIGGGLAVGAFGGKSEIMNVFSPTVPGHLSQSGTFNGNRATMAAGCAALKQYDQAACDRLEVLAQRLEMKLTKAFEETGIEGCVTRSGSLMNYHFSDVVPTDYLSACKDRKEPLRIMHLELLKRGFFLAPRGTIALSTPMTELVIDGLGDAFEDSLLEIRKSI